MTITRTINGQEIVIELTSIELNQAYHEELRELDICTIQEYIQDIGTTHDDEYPSEFIDDLIKNRVLLTEWADEYREMIDYGWSREGAWDRIEDYMDDELDEWLEDHLEFKEDKN